MGKILKNSQLGTLRLNITRAKKHASRKVESYPLFTDLLFQVVPPPGASTSSHGRSLSTRRRTLECTSPGLTVHPAAGSGSGTTSPRRVGSFRRSTGSADRPPLMFCRRRPSWPEVDIQATSGWVRPAFRFPLLRAPPRLAHDKVEEGKLVNCFGRQREGTDWKVERWAFKFFGFQGLGEVWYNDARTSLVDNFVDQWIDFPPSGWIYFFNRRIWIRYGFIIEILSDLVKKE